MFRAIRFGAALAVPVVMSGCAGSDVERAGIGAVAGGVGAAAIGSHIAAGALIGAAAGAFADDITQHVR